MIAEAISYPARIPGSRILRDILTGGPHPVVIKHCIGGGQFITGPVFPGVPLLWDKTDRRTLAPFYSSLFYLTNLFFYLVALPHFS